MKKLIFFSCIAFAVALGIVAGTRLSPDAMAVVIGIICGVLASIPTSAMLVWVMRQRDKQEAQFGSMRYAGQYPPVVVVNGQHPNGYPTSYPGPASIPLPSGVNGSRNFKVIGQENTETTGDALPPFWEDL